MIDRCPYTKIALLENIVIYNTLLLGYYKCVLEHWSFITGLCDETISCKNDVQTKADISALHVCRFRCVRNVDVLTMQIMCNTSGAWNVVINKNHTWALSKI